MHLLRAKLYPGETASEEQVFRLAEQYRKAAHLFLQFRSRGDPLSLAPCRLSAIQSIELFLNVLLLHVGYGPARIRGMKHDLAVKTAVAIESGLRLRKRTAAHLIAMTESREYLITRYGPELTATTSQINRLIATLDEVAGKVTATVRRESLDLNAKSPLQERQSQRTYVKHDVRESV